MGGGGGSGPSRPSPNLREQIDRAIEREREHLDSDVRRYLDELLVNFNDRDVERDGARLEELKERLGDKVELDALFLGGSVAKHTAVDGISDIDALVVLDSAEMRDKKPAEVLEVLRKVLSTDLPRREIESVEKGHLAITIRYTDGREIQLLPAVASGSNVKISDATAREWKEISHKRFARELTKANEAVGGSLVPAIKLVKGINDTLPAQKRMTGYHLEALAVDAMKRYEGAKTVKAVLEHVLEHSAYRVMQPIADITGQSRTADDYLGTAGSMQRRIVSQTLAGIRRRLGAANSVTGWKAVFEG